MRELARKWSACLCRMPRDERISTRSLFLNTSCPSLVLAVEIFDKKSGL
jgi:hypothetical protein